jgi:hypothetical protein
MEVYSQDIRDRVLLALVRESSPMAIRESSWIEPSLGLQGAEPAHVDETACSLPIGGHRRSDWSGWRPIL